MKSRFLSRLLLPCWEGKGSQNVLQESSSERRNLEGTLMFEGLGRMRSGGLNSDEGGGQMQKENTDEGSLYRTPDMLNGETSAEWSQVDLAGAWSNG